MNDSERRKKLAHAVSRLRLLEAGLPKLVAVLDEYEDGIPSQRYDGDWVRGRTTRLDECGIPMPDLSDPTGERVVVEGEPDAARAARLEFDRCILRLEADAGALDDIRRGWLLTAAQRKQLRKEAGADDEGCEVMATVGVWEPMHVYSDVNANLDRKWRLGRWAYDWVLRHGQLPPHAARKARKDGKRYREKAS